MEWLFSPEASLWSLLLAAFLAATLIPLSSEVALFAVLKLHQDLLWPAIGIATLGNTLGGLTSYAIGRLIARGKPLKQVERVRRYGARAPFSAELRVRDRKRRQAELLAMLRAREAKQRLAQWAQDWEAGREPAYAETSRATRAEYVDLLLDLDRTLSAEQREHAARRLKRYASLFESLTRQ